MKFSVTINDSPRHIVSAKSTLGAVKATMEAIESETDDYFRNDLPLEIKVEPISPKAKA